MHFVEQFAGPLVVLSLWPVPKSVNLHVVVVVFAVVVVVVGVLPVSPKRNYWCHNFASLRGSAVHRMYCLLRHCFSITYNLSQFNLRIQFA